MATSGLLITKFPMAKQAFFIPKKTSLLIKYHILELSLPNFGFLNRANPESRDSTDKLFVQEGRKVFKEVVPMVAKMIIEHGETLGLSGSDLRRMWLHQANAGMNRLIAQRVLGHEASDDESPTVLDSYANTSSAGSIIAFHKHSDDLNAGDVGLICSFGAGYSAGSVFIRKAA